MLHEFLTFHLSVKMIEAPREMPQNAVHLSPRWAIPCGVLAAALQSHALKTLSTKTMEKLVTYQKRILLKGRSFGGHNTLVALLLCLVAHFTFFSSKLGVV